MWAAVDSGGTATFSRTFSATVSITCRMCAHICIYRKCNIFSEKTCDWPKSLIRRYIYFMAENSWANSDYFKYRNCFKVGIILTFVLYNWKFHVHLFVCCLCDVSNGKSSFSHEDILKCVWASWETDMMMSWFSVADEHLNREHIADHTAQGISGWWKWITNEQPGKLQASAPELPQLKRRRRKKTITETLLHSWKKKNWQEVTSLLRQNCDAPLLLAAHLSLLSLETFTSTSSKDQSYRSWLPSCTKKKDTKISSLQIRGGGGRRVCHSTWSQCIKPFLKICCTKWTSEFLWLLFVGVHSVLDTRRYFIAPLFRENNLKWSISISTEQIP